MNQQSQEITRNLTIQRLKLQYGRFKLLLILSTLLTAAGFIGYTIGERSLTLQRKLVQSQQDRLDELYRQSDQQLQQINFLHVEIEIEKQAAQQVKTQLQAQHEENFKLQKQLSFYQKIMAPELEADGMEIDSFTMTPNKALRSFHYKVVLVQTQKSKRYARGFVECRIKGSYADHQEVIDIATLITDFDKKMLAFNFQYFQILEGDLTLPPEFSAETILLSAILPTGKWQKYARLERQYPFLEDRD